MTHICIGKLTIIGSDNGLSPDRRQAIICTNAGILSIRTIGTNFSEILSKTHVFIQENTFENVVWKMAAVLSRPQYVNMMVYAQKKACQRLFSHNCPNKGYFVAYCCPPMSVLEILSMLVNGVP